MSLQDCNAFTQPALKGTGCIRLSVRERQKQTYRLEDHAIHRYDTPDDTR